MAKIRVLIVDDSVVIRKILTDALSEDSEIEIAGVAANGKIAVQKITQCNPDIITLDVEMPELNGIETVRKIRETHPKLPIIMFSTLTERGAAATMDALSAGATDYVTKPANVGSVSVAKERVKVDLLAKIKNLVNKAPIFSPQADVKQVNIKTSLFPSNGQVPKQVYQSKNSNISIVAIGVSTGGPNALAEVIPAIPQDFPVPIVIVQHMPPLFTKMLAERLNDQSKVRVHEGEQNMLVEAGHVYIAPGNYHMELVRNERDLRIRLHQGPQENSCRPAVDPLFSSVVSAFGPQTLGVILTGMGQDGLRGSELIKEIGGQVIAQDELSSVVWGMPGYVVNAGLADSILPLNEIATEIVRRVKRSQISINLNLNEDRSV